MIINGVQTVTKCVLLFSLWLLLPSLAAVGTIEGTWAYEASGTPYEYAKGEITIRKEADSYQVWLHINQMTIPVKEVAVENKKVMFSLYIEDAKVEVTLHIDGDVLTGEAKTYDGSFPLKGKRK